LKIKLQKDGKIYEPETFYGRDLAYLHSIELPSKGILEGATIEIACDVTSPFVGPNGAVAVCRK
jgi:glycerate kinase